ncbi:MAG: endonuclease/exonuclease/phosphatase family protein [Planctomycetes bacterium]|nr:endonuclease/exonuclease/phosphatase family protein [Planctomycetota bacterium]
MAKQEQTDVLRPRLVRRMVPWIFSFACALLFIRLTIRDAVPIIAVLFYIGQPFILAILFVLGACMWPTRGRRRVIGKSVNILLATTALAMWCVDSFRDVSVVPAAKSYSALTWNVMNGKLGWRSIFRTLREFDADVIVLVEAHDFREEADSLRLEFLPEYRVTSCDSGLCLLTRGGIIDDAIHRLADGGRLRETTVSLDGKQLKFFAVDILSNPLRGRRAPLEALAVRAAEIREMPLIVTGDFNTPPNSVHFEQLRQCTSHAFETVGDGFGPTWPSVAPVLLLDQFWTNAKLKPLCCRAGWSVASDHRPVVLTFSIE